MDLDTGWAVSEGRSAIAAWVDDLDQVKIERAAGNAREIWCKNTLPIF